MDGSRMEKRSDRIVIRDLALWCVIGTKKVERENKQKVVLNLEIECDLSPAGRSDRIEDTVNYMKLKKRLAAFVEESSFFLLEALADRVASMCLKEALVRAVRVTIDKPGALTKARSVAVDIIRRKS